MPSQPPASELCTFSMHKAGGTAGDEFCLQGTAHRTCAGAHCRWSLLFPSPSAAVCSAADLKPAFVTHILDVQLALNASLAL